MVISDPKWLEDSLTWNSAPSNPVDDIRKALDRMRDPLKQTIRGDRPADDFPIRWQPVDETGKVTLAHERAQALNEWLKSSPWATHGFVVGSAPDGSGVRVVRLLEIGSTALVWIDIPPELADSEYVVRYALTRLQGELILGGQRKIEWSAVDAWLVALQGMVGLENAVRLKAVHERFGNQMGDVFNVGGSRLTSRFLPLMSLRAGGLDWAEEELQLGGIQFNPLTRIPPFPPACLDVDRARQAIDEADRVFGI